MPDDEVVVEDVGGIAGEVDAGAGSIAGEDPEGQEGEGGGGGIADGNPEADKRVDEDGGGVQGTDGKEEGTDTDAYTLSAPEGFPIPEGNLKSFTEAAHKAKLSREQAEAMLAWHKELHEQTVKANEEATKEAFAAWDKEIKEDPKYGGQNYQKSFAKARKGVAFADGISPGFRKFLVDTGADKNPHVFRIACELGMLTGEDDVVGGSRGRNRADIPLEKRLWPNM